MAKLNWGKRFNGSDRHDAANRFDEPADPYAKPVNASWGAASSLLHPLGRKLTTGVDGGSIDVVGAVEASKAARSQAVGQKPRIGMDVIAKLRLRR